MKTIIILIFMLFSVLAMLTVVFEWVSFDSDKCSMSEHNTYTNMTGGIRIFDSCYVPTNSIVTSTTKCGFMGFSCRTVEPYGYNSGGAVCFKLKNGKLC